jgi:hypothetical protein
MHGDGTLHRADDLRDFGVIALTDVHRHQVLEIDPAQVLEITGHEVAPRLLAIGDDVDACELLFADGEPRRVALGLCERRAFQQPRRPQLIGLREPRRLGQAACDRRLQERLGHFSSRFALFR